MAAAEGCTLKHSSRKDGLPEIEAQVTLNQSLFTLHGGIDDPS